MNEEDNATKRSWRSALIAIQRPFLDGRVPDTFWQLGFLFAVDMITNTVDFIFHVYLGRALPPSGFAVVQTVNSLLLILITAFAVLQPVVARLAAQAIAEGEKTAPAAIFQAFFWQSLLLGGLLAAAVLLLRNAIASWLNVPTAAVAIMSLMVVLALTRPVAAGMLQGLQRFVSYGLTRTVYALTRLLAAFVLVGVLGGGALAGVIAMPVGGLVALAAGLAFLGAGVWRRGESLPGHLVSEGWRLSIAALLAYSAFMGLQNIDLIWVNRSFAADTAGVYGSVVVLRRVLAVLPGAVIVILYPRVVSAVTRGILPDKILFKAGGVVVAVNAVVALIYFFFGPEIMALIFGAGYQASGLILGWMGLSMIGFGIGVVWLNLFLATRPWPFVLVILAALLGEGLLLGLLGSSTEATAAIFGISGWLLAIAGFLLYMAWLRPYLSREGAVKELSGGF